MAEAEHPETAAEGRGPAIVLVEPQLGENIGMVARAMANFGLSDLRIVNPRDGWPNEKARAAASRADAVIDGARVFTTTEEALADLTYVVATTARPRDSEKSVLGPEEATAKLHARAGEGVGILFGRERHGLSNEEIDLADEIVTFPVNPEFASLNIAQAVLLMSYEWSRQAGLGTGRPRLGAEAPPAPPARKEDLFRLFERLEGALDERGYFFPEAKRAVMIHNLRNLLTRAALSEPEVHALHGVVRSLTRRHGES